MIRSQRIFVAFALVLVASARWLAAEPVFMGNITSVYTDSDFNALRNPALIIMQKSRESIGLALSGKAYNTSDVSNELILAVLPDPVIDYSRKYYSFDMALSYTRRFDNWAVGIGLSGLGSEFILYNDEHRKYSSGISAIETDYKTLEVNPALFFSLSRKIERRHSVGIMISPGFSFVNWDRDGYRQVAPAFWRMKVEKNTYIFSIELAAGYLFKGNRFQAGLLVNSGKLVFEKIKISQDFENYITPALSKSGEDELGYLARYQGDAGFTAGMYYRLFKNMGLMLEASCIVPAEYKTESLGFSTATGTFDRLKNTITLDPDISVKCGFQYSIDHDLSLSIGAGYNHRSENLTNDTDDVTTEISTVMGTFGIDYRFSDMITMMAGSKVSNVHTELEEIYTNQQFYSAENQWRFDLILGVSFAFYDADYHLEPREK